MKHKKIYYEEGNNDLGKKIQPFTGRNEQKPTLQRGKNTFKMKTLKNFVKNAGLTIGGIVIVTASFWHFINSPIITRNYLTPQDFDNVRWIEFYNPQGIIKSDFYNNENIPHSSANWGMYQDKVREKNKNKLEGTILLPDLDSDRKVGKNLNIKEGEK